MVHHKKDEDPFGQIEYGDVENEQLVPQDDSDSMPRYPDRTTAGMLRLLDYVGTVVFAISGTLTASASGLDRLGCMLVATVTAVGGGTVRDVLIGNTPVFWMVETEYLWICLISSFLTTMSLPFFQSLVSTRAMNLCDDVGLGTFTVIGAQNGIRKDLSPVVCVLCGVISATFGGLIRDVLCNQPPRILYSHAELYATTALMGAVVYVGLRELNYSKKSLGLRIVFGGSISVAMRGIARHHDLKLAVFRPNG